jgi:hypothetical protein
MPRRETTTEEKATQMPKKNIPKETENNEESAQTVVRVLDTPNMQSMVTICFRGLAHATPIQLNEICCPETALRIPYPHSTGAPLLEYRCSRPTALTAGCQNNLWSRLPLYSLTIRLFLIRTHLSPTFCCF